MYSRLLLLSVVGEKGAKEGFYSGPIAEAIVQASQEFDGLLTLDDLARHATALEEPISTVYKGIRVYQTPPPSHGLAVLCTLNILTALDSLRRPGPPDGMEAGFQHTATPFANTFTQRNHADQAHVAIEATRRGYADALQYIGDPRHCDLDQSCLQPLLSEAYALNRAREIDLHISTPVLASDIQGMDTYNASLAAYSKGETVYFSVVDQAGNACSMINSNYMSFGTGIMPKGTGFTLQNRGCNFSLLPSHNNCAAPYKRPYHTIIPGLATFEEDRSLYAVFGNMVRQSKPACFAFERFMSEGMVRV